MDEVRMVRDSYPEPAPPTAREITRAKALLNESPRRTLPGPRWKPAGSRWRLAGVVAAGTAATVAITLAGGNTPGGGDTPGGGNTPARRPVLNLDGRRAILAAAENAERQPIGQYWYADQIQGQSYVVRPATGTYAITGALSESFSWSGSKHGMGEAYYIRDLPARPQTMRDAVMWRKAGSPPTFRVWSGDHYATYSTKESRWRTKGPEVGTDSHGGGRFLDGKTVADLRRLPADPVKLGEMFLSPAEMSRAAGLPPGKRPDPAQVADAQISRLSSMLDAPIPPKVRAGLMRALAAQPGIRAIGHAIDPLGRPGVALAGPERATTVTGESGGQRADVGTYRSREVIVFDQRTGALLSRQQELTRPGGRYAEMKPGFVIEYSAVRSAAWTDTKPTPPAALPFG